MEGRHSDSEKTVTEFSKQMNMSYKNNHIVIKVGMIGESQTGKTSLMVKYVENRFDEDYIETLGVNFMEKTINLRNIAVTFSVWDLGGQKEYLQLMPLVCNDARVLLFVFDLTCKQSLLLIREWYRQARTENRYAVPFLIGTKFDLFAKRSLKYKKEMTAQARKFSKAMKAPMIFCSSSHSINIKKIFQLIIAKVFHLRPKVLESTKVTEPIIEYKAYWSRSKKGRMGRSEKNDEGQEGEKGRK